MCREVRWMRILWAMCLLMLSGIKAADGVKCEQILSDEEFDKVEGPLNMADAIITLCVEVGHIYPQKRHLINALKIYSQNPKKNMLAKDQNSLVADFFGLSPEACSIIKRAKPQVPLMSLAIKIAALDDENLRLGDESEPKSFDVLEGVRLMELLYMSGARATDDLVMQATLLKSSSAIKVLVMHQPELDFSRALSAAVEHRVHSIATLLIGHGYSKGVLAKFRRKSYPQSLFHEAVEQQDWGLLRDLLLVNPSASKIFAPTHSPKAGRASKITDFPLGKRHDTLIQ